ncbi:MAG: DUF1499 domain-containing protein [Salaquimonas sp.]
MRKIMVTVLWFILAVILIVTATFAIDRDGFWTRLAGDPDLGQTDFHTLRPAPKPNEALICPEGFCPNRQPDAVPKTYNLPAEELRDKFAIALAAQADTVRLDDNANPLTLRYVSRTKWMRFPDTISIEFVPLSKTTSTLAIHAKAKLGYSDMGNNLDRVKNWLNVLDEAVKS